MLVSADSAHIFQASISRLSQFVPCWYQVTLPIHSVLVSAALACILTAYRLNVGTTAQCGHNSIDVLPKAMQYIGRSKHWSLPRFSWI